MMGIIFLVNSSKKNMVLVMDWFVMMCMGIMVVFGIRVFMIKNRMKVIVKVIRRLIIFGVD